MKTRLVSALALVLVTGLGLSIAGSERTGSGENPPADPRLGARAAVLLIPGYGGERVWLGSLQEALEGAGFVVRYPETGDQRGDLEESAKEVVTEAVALSEQYRQVFVIGYSTGGVIARLAERDTEFSSRVVRLVSIAAPHAGTWLERISDFPEGECASSLACQQLRPGSELLRELGSPRKASRWLNLYSSADEILQPADSGSWERARGLAGSYDVTCASRVGHLDVPQQQEAIKTILQFVSDGEASYRCPQ